MKAAAILPRPARPKQLVDVGRGKTHVSEHENWSVQQQQQVVLVVVSGPPLKMTPQNDEASDRQPTQGPNAHLWPGISHSSSGDAGGETNERRDSPAEQARVDHSQTYRSYVLFTEVLVDAAAGAATPTAKYTAGAAKYNCSRVHL